MLKLRLTRIGRKNKPQYRVVAAEHSSKVKGKFVEVLGHYHPLSKPKTFVIKKERVEYWISKGAQPSSAVAGLLKTYSGMTNMERYMKPRLKDLKPKKELAKAKKQAPAAAPKKEETKPA